MDAITGSSVPLTPDPPVVGPRFRRSVTIAAALLVVLFVAAVGGLVTSGSRLDDLTLPEASLALVVGATMDVRVVVERQARWERFVSELLMSDRVDDLAEAIGWYEELVESAREPGVELQLAILEGEAGRLARLREKLEGWDVRPAPYPTMAAAIRAAYLGEIGEAPDDGGDLPADGHAWFAEQIALRLALRAGDQARAARIVAARAARTAPLATRVRVLAVLEVALLAGGVLAIFSLARQPPAMRLASAPIPPPWPGRLGAVVLIRGAALQVLLLIGLWALSYAASSAVVNALSWPWSNLFFLPMLLIARRYLIRPWGFTMREAFGFTLERGARIRLVLVVIALIGLGLVGDFVTGTLATASGATGHWTEWFDEDLVWGSRTDAALSIVSAVVAAPVFEEAVFRGLLYTTLRSRFGVIVSALASAAIFAVLHGYGWAGLASVLWSGALWAWSYERTRSLIPGMLAHAMVNLLATLGLLLLLRS